MLDIEFAGKAVLSSLAMFWKEALDFQAGARDRVSGYFFILEEIGMCFFRKPWKCSFVSHSTHHLQEEVVFWGRRENK